jgi:hypothetical protein
MLISQVMPFTESFEIIAFPVIGCPVPAITGNPTRLGEVFFSGRALVDVIHIFIEMHKEVMHINTFKIAPNGNSQSGRF